MLHNKTRFNNFYLLFKWPKETIKQKQNEFRIAERYGKLVIFCSENVLYVPTNYVNFTSTNLSSNLKVYILQRK